MRSGSPRGARVTHRRGPAATAPILRTAAASLGAGRLLHGLEQVATVRRRRAAAGRRCPREASNGYRRPSPRQRPPTAPEPSSSSAANATSSGATPSTSRPAGQGGGGGARSRDVHGPSCDAAAPRQCRRAGRRHEPLEWEAGQQHQRAARRRQRASGRARLVALAFEWRGCGHPRRAQAGSAPGARGRALRELQRLHSQLTGAAGSKALGSLESAWQQQASDDPGAPGGGSSGSGGGRAGVGGAGGNSATQNAITAQQRELNQLTIQRQRLQQQQREQRNELHSVTSELEKREERAEAGVGSAQAAALDDQRQRLTARTHAAARLAGRRFAIARRDGRQHHGAWIRRQRVGRGWSIAEPIVPKLQVGSAAPSKASSAPSRARRRGLQGRRYAGGASRRQGRQGRGRREPV